MRPPLQRTRTNPAPPDVTVPGGLVSFFLLTVLTVLIALFAENEEIDPVLRPLYFAVLFSFFYAIGREQPEIRGLPFRLIERGFFVLTLGFSTAAAMRTLEISFDNEIDSLLLTTLERGAVFLLGTSLISYGIMLWIPQLLQSQRVLRERYDRTQGKLVLSETARSRMEQRFVEADRLHALGELAAGVAHDLRNPLAIIKGAASSLAQPNRTPAELTEHTDVICRNIDRAERTIASLLDLGRPRELSKRPVIFDRVVRDVLRLVEVESRRFDVRVLRGCEPGVVGDADPKLLGQVLLNLVLNAMQASPEHSEVRVRARSFCLDGHELAVLAVEDRGHGIQPTVRSSLFTPFFTTKPGGTGLGLLSSRKIVDDLGGKIGLFPRTRGGARSVLVLTSAPAPIPEEVAVS